ncbi:hypothetical protein BG015_005802 [Linnemannia schmuckeri]|uniref:Core Histone H2A/H2B/H3 domain-containing protein n=1 Tax=Linnemannia schmuckeri TaxID=64567 RepID=A0A9P5S978_9FUNG|nr:hypothetical protein BG015_005802 [Linnemannia schmuckeri]
MAHQRQDSTGSAYDPSAATHYQHQMQLHQHQQHQQHPQYPMMNQQQHDPSAPSSHQPPMQHPHMQLLHSFWMNQMHDIENVPQDFKIHHLPLARIKKVMKTDEDVKAKMISAEAPMIFDKGCEIFITELTIRAWIHAEENKRRTLQRSDIAAAISKTDMFDFLIDIVPREEFKAAKEAKEAASGHGKSASGGGIEHRLSQESFPTMGGAGPGGPTAAGGSGGPIGLEGYGYPYGMLENGQFSMGPGGGGEGMDPYQQQLQLQYMRAQMAQQQQQHVNPQQQRYDFQQQQHMSHGQQSSEDGSQQLPPEGW